MTFNEGGLCIQAQEQWYADGAEDTLRLLYPLTDNSVVFDVGGYAGWWTEELLRCCAPVVPHVQIFEPVRQFADLAKERFANNPKVYVNSFGLGSWSGSALFKVDQYSSGLFSTTGKKNMVEIRDVAEVMKDNVDLMSINIEGGEYSLLFRMLKQNLVRNVRNLQIQFHNLFVAAAAYRDEIRFELARTHTEVWNYPFVWESWQRKEQ